MLNAIKAMVAARTIDEAWQHYVQRMASMHFPNVYYLGARVLESADTRLVGDSLLLSNLPPGLIQDIQSQGLVESVPMFRWWVDHRGSESWDWMRARAQAGELVPDEERALALFALYGHAAGYAISLSDRVLRQRAGVLICGAPGASQKALDRLWDEYGGSIEALTELLHLRLATLPYVQPETLLTRRQREVLEAIAVGHTTQEIASILELTVTTVEKHLRLARKALEARTTIQAVILAACRQQIFLDQGKGCVAVELAHAGGATAATIEPWTLVELPSAPPIAVCDTGQS